MLNKYKYLSEKQVTVFAIKNKKGTAKLLQK